MSLWKIDLNILTHIAQSMAKIHPYMQRKVIEKMRESHLISVQHYKMLCCKIYLYPCELLVYNNKAAFIMSLLFLKKSRPYMAVQKGS